MPRLTYKLTVDELLADRPDLLQAMRSVNKIERFIDLEVRYPNTNWRKVMATLVQSGKIGASELEKFVKREVK